MANDDMKKMLMLVESCSCEQTPAAGEVPAVEEEQVNEIGGDLHNRIISDLQAMMPRVANNPAATEALKKALEVVQQLLRGKKGPAAPPEGENNAMEEDFDLDAFMESLYEMSGEQIDEISAKKAFGAAGARGLQAVGKLAKAPIGAGLSFGASVAAGLSPDRKQGEEWIDRSDMARDKTIDLVTTAGQRAGQAVKNFGRGVTKALGEGEEDVSTTKMSTAQEMAEKLFAENPKMTSDDVLDKGYKLVLSQHGKGRADRLFHFNADFAEELVDMYNQIKDEASKSTVESDDAEFQSFMETLNYVMRKK